MDRNGPALSGQVAQNDRRNRRKAASPLLFCQTAPARFESWWAHWFFQWIPNSYDTCAQTCAQRIVPRQ